MRVLRIGTIGRTRASDPEAMGSVVQVLVLTGMLACVVPALHAAHTSPMHALRGE